MASNLVERDVNEKVKATSTHEDLNHILTPFFFSVSGVDSSQKSDCVVEKLSAI